MGIKLLSLLFVSLAALLIACGGDSTSGSTISRDAGADFLTRYPDSLTSWQNIWRDSGIQNLDKDFSGCFGPDEPAPPYPAPPDPSGHTRGRVPCEVAVNLLKEATPQYEGLIRDLGIMKGIVPDGAAKTFLIDFEAVHQEKIGMWRQAISAGEKKDWKAVTSLRLPYFDLIVKEKILLAKQ